MSPRSDRSQTRNRVPALLAPPTTLHPDEALLLLGMGTFGTTVLQILRQEFRRFCIDKGRLFQMSLDPHTAASDANGVPDTGCLPRGKPFDRKTYVQQQAALGSAVSHLPDSALQETSDRPPRFPAQGLVDFHHDDEHRITSTLLALVDQARAANPDRLLRCVAVWALGDAFAAGAAVPLLYRLRDHLVHRKVSLEAFVVGSADVQGPASAQRPGDVDPACIEVASAMLWESTGTGDFGFPYPGKNGLREDHTYRGPLAHRTWIFSGAGMQSPSAVASTVARCIETLATTRLGRRLEAERVRYTEDYLERTWSGKQGKAHPTNLLTLNVAGLKLDILPAIFHLRQARRIVESWTAVLTEDEEQTLRDEAERLLQNTGTSDAAIPAQLGVGNRPLTLDEVQAATLSEATLHDYLSKRLDEDLGTLYAYGEGSRKPAKMPALVAATQEAIQKRTHLLSRPATGSLLRAIAFTRALERILEERLRLAQERQRRSKRILASLGDKKRLATLLERVRRDTSQPKSRHWGIIQRFVATITVSVPMQVRKILEVASGVRETAFDVASATLLVDVYGQLLHSCERQREDLQRTLRTLNNVASLCSREEEQTQRTARSAYTYPRTRIETLLDRLCSRLSEHVDIPPDARENVELFASDDDENAWYAKILRLARPDPVRLAEAADEVMASEPLVREALKESLAQFAPMVRIDRDRFAQLETARLRFALCTRWMFEVNRDLFDGYELIECESPYNVLVSQHEEGLPFLALRCMRRAQEHYRVEEADGRTSLAHAQATFAASLPHLDD